MTVSKTPPGIGTAFRNFDYEEEIRRIKRSLGDSGGGGGGTSGVTALSYAIQTAAGATVTVPVGGGVWTLLPFGTIAITTTDGTPDFVRNADGSLTIKKDGVYSFNAGLGNGNTTTTGPGLTDMRLVKVPVDVSSLNPGYAICFSRQNNLAGDLAVEVLATTAFCAVNERVHTLMFQTMTPAPLCNVNFFSCVREGGPPGPQGPQGPQGLAGASDANYIHTQSVLASTWVVTHPLNKRPSVTVVDSGDSEILPDVRYDSNSQITISFGAATSGKVYLN